MKKFLFTLYLSFLCLFLYAAAEEEKTFLFIDQFHNDVRSLIEAETQVPIEYFAVTIDEFDHKDSYFYDIFEDREMIPLDCEEKDEMLLSLPYIWDYGVIISRKNENDILQTASKLKEKKYITISGIFSVEKYIIANKQKLSYNITTKTTPFNSFSKIFKGEADFTVLPSRVADKLLQETGMKTELAVSGSPEYYIMKFNYRLAVKKEDKATLVKINDIIYDMYKKGTLAELLKKHHLSQSFIPVCTNSQDLPINSMITVLNTVMISMTLCILQITFLMSKVRSKKADRINNSNNGESLASLELKRQVDEYLQGKVTLTEQTMKDPYSGLFAIDYFKDGVEEDIRRYTNFDQDFSVAIIKFKDNPSITAKILKDAADMVQEDFSKDCMCSYNGNGAFLVLFPKRTKNDVEIFIEGAAEHLERITNLRFETEVLQYGTTKQSEFMERLCLQ
ncbi:MAG: transporter substrate-binding domain-containing protein [Treponemataceae bacterium]|nr:transporter substrate-binding domain-containing protein [Treponemataceae bacterium]